MTLEEIYYISQSIASIAVVASILYLALQTRQAVKSQNAIARQARTARSIEIVLTTTEPSLAEAVDIGLDGDEDLSPTQLRQFQGYCRALFISAEDTFLAHQAGTMDGATFESFVQASKHLTRSPGLRAVWRNFRQSRRPTFVAFYEALMAEAPLAEHVDVIAQWKEDLATVRAQALRQALAEAT